MHTCKGEVGQKSIVEDQRRPTLDDRPSIRPAPVRSGEGNDAGSQAKRF
jgi:hypothetical protein